MEFYFHTWYVYGVEMYKLVNSEKNEMNEKQVTLNEFTSNGFWCIGIKGEMSGTVCVTFTWDIYIYMSCL